MRNYLELAAAALAVVALAAPAVAAEPAKPAEKAAPATPAAPAAAAKDAPKYTSEDTEIGTLLDDPAAKAIVEKHVPGFTTNEQVDMARAMTLKAVQTYAPDSMTDAVLAAIDADFAKLPK